MEARVKTYLNNLSPFLEPPKPGPKAKSLLASKYSEMEGVIAAGRELAFNGISMDKVFAHIHLGALIADSPYEGMPPSVFSEFLEYFIKDRPQTEGADAVKRVARQVKIRNSKKIIIEVGSLKPGESFAMEGGWYGKHPHSLFYEFTRKSNGHYDIFIYGMQSWDDPPLLEMTNFGEVKGKSPPFVLFKDVPPKVLISRVGVIAEALNELFTLNEENKDREYSYKDVFSCFGTIARDYLCNDTIDLFKTPQHSGNCAWRSLQALLHSRMVASGSSGYKALIFHFKFSSLIAFKRQWTKNGITPWRLHHLKRATETLFRSLEKMVREGLKILKPDEYKAHFEALTTLKHELECLKATVPKSEELPPVKPKGLWFTNLEVPKIAKPDPGPPPKSVWLSGKVPKNRASVAYLKQIATELNAICKTRSSGEMVAIAESLIQTLPVPQVSKCPWKILKPDEAKAALTEFQKINEEFVGWVIKSNRAAQPSVYVAQLSLYAIAAQLFSIVEPELGKKYGVDLWGLEKRLRKDHDFIFEDPILFNRHEEALTFFAHFNSGKQLLFDFKETTKLPLDIAFHKSLVDRSPSLKKTLEQDEKSMQPAFVWHDASAWILFADFGRHSELLVSSKTSLFYTGKLQSPLARFGLTHVLALKQAALAMALILYPAKSGMLATKLRYYRNDLKGWDMGSSLGSWDNLIKAGKRPSSRRLFLGEKLVKVSSEHPRMACDIPLENKHIVDTHANDDPSVKLLRNLSEPGVQVSALIAHFKRGIHYFAKREHRVFADLMLFKPVGKRGGAMSIPLFDALKDRAVCDQLRLFVEEGVNRFWRRQPGQLPKVEPLCYFLRLAHKLQCCARKLGVKSTPFIKGERVYLRRWLADKSFKGRERALLQYHLVSSYMAEGKTAWTNEEWQEILETWIALCQGYGIEKLGESAEDSIHLFDVQKWMTTVGKPPSAAPLQHVLLRAFKTLGLSPEKVADWSSVHFPICHSKSDWWIDLLSGEIGKGKHRVGRVTIKPSTLLGWLLEAEGEIEVVSLGNSWAVDSSLYGPLEVLPREGGSNHIFCDHKGKRLRLLNLPWQNSRNAFNGDYTFWRDDVNGEVYGIRRTTGKQELFAGSDGRCRRGKVVYNNVGLEGPLSEFETSSYALHLTSPSGLRQLCFVRYGLVLDRDNGWRHPLYPAYRLTMPPPNSPLTGVKGILHFLDEGSGRSKVLIPWTVFTRSGIQEVKSDRQLQFDEKPVYDTRNYTLVDISAEGEFVFPSVSQSILLAYLYQMQGNARQAMKMLGQISLSSHPNDDDLGRIESIIRGHKKDHTSNTNAVRLFAIHLLLHFQRTTGKKVKLSKQIKEHIDDYYREYCDTKNWVYHDLRLEPEVELAILSYISGPYAQKRGEFLKSGKIRSQKGRVEREFSGIFWGKMTTWNCCMRGPHSVRYRKDDFEAHYRALRDGALQDRNRVAEFLLRFVAQNPGVVTSAKSLTHLQLLEMPFHEGANAPRLRNKGESLDVWKSMLIEARKKRVGAGKANVKVAVRVRNRFSSAVRKLVPLNGAHKLSNAPSIPFPTTPRDAWAKSLRSFGHSYERGERDVTPPPFGEKESTHKVFSRAITSEMGRYRGEWTQADPHRANGWIDDFGKFAELLNAGIKEVGQIANGLEQAILHEVERGAPVNAASRWGKDQKVEIEDLVLWSLVGREPFKRFNPSLTDGQIAHLREAISRFLEFKTEWQHLKRMEPKLKGMKVTDLYQHLYQERAYEGREAASLAFEFFNDIRIRHDQHSLITKCAAQLKKGRSGIFQLMMGGGKSTVIATALSRLITLMNGVTLFVSHHSQWASLLATAPHLQRKSYRGDLVPIDMSCRQLADVKNLDQILADLKRAKDKKWPVAMASRMVMLLELEYITLGLSLDQKEKGKERFAKVGQILRFLMTECRGLIDEADQTLHAMTGLRRRTHSAQKVKPKITRTSLIADIYRILVTQFKKRHNLIANNQVDMSVEYPKIVSDLVEEVAKLPALGMKKDKEQQAQFKAYVLLNEKKGKFVVDYDKDGARSSGDAKERSHLIALAKQFVKEVLPSTIGKFYNMEFGPNKDGKIVWYQGVKTPAPTEFGFIYEEIAYMIQAVLQPEGLSERDVLRFAKAMREAADFYVGRDGVRFEETLEAVQFLQMTGVELAEIERPGKLKAATESLRKNPEDLIAFGIEKVQLEAGFDSERHTATPLNLFHRLFGSIGYSGTLYNATTFPRELREHNLTEQKTEGEILRLLARKARNPTPIDAITIDAMVSKVENHLQLERLQGLIDVGGLFRYIEVEKFAKRLLQVKGRDGNFRYDGLLTVYRNEKGEAAFGIYRRGSDKPLPLASTRKEAIAQYGIPEKKIFVLFDQLRATGTDIPQPDDALNLVTLDPAKMNIRSLLQGVMRLRRLFEKQDIDYVIHKTHWEQILKKDIRNLVPRLIENQGIERARQEYRSAREQIRAVIRKAILDEQLSQKDGQTILPKYRELLVEKVTDSPYEQWGGLLPDEDPMVALKAFKEATYKAYESCKPPIDKLKGVKRELEALLGSFKKDFLPNHVPHHLRAGQEGTRVEIEEHQEQETETEQEQETELHKYQAGGIGTPRKEVDWFDEVEFSDYSHKLVSLETHSKAAVRKDLDDFSPLFTPSHGIRLMATKNFCTVDDHDRSIFDKLRKPADHFLIYARSPEEWDVVLLSLHDFDHFKKWCKGKKNVGLFNSNGSYLSGRRFKESRLQRAIWSVNLYQGNLSSLQKNGYRRFTEEWLIKGNVGLKRKYLRLRAAESKQRWTLYLRSPLLQPPSQKGVSSSIFQCSSRQREVANRIEWVQALDERGVQKLKPLFLECLRNEQVKWCLEDQVPHLPTHLVKHVSKAQVPGLTEEQVPHLPAAFVPLLDAKQVPHVQSKQVCRVRFNLIHLLPPEQFDSVTAPQLKHYLASSHRDPKIISHLKEAMIPLLPDEWVPGKLEDWQLLYVKPTLVNKFSTKDWERATNKVFGQGDRINCLHRLIAAMNTDLIQHLSIDQIHHVSPQAANHLFNSQWNKIAKRAKEFTKWLQAVPVEHLPKGKSRFVAHLSLAQIRKLGPENTAPHLEKSQWQAMEGDWAGWLNRVKVVSPIPARLVPQLNESQVAKLESNHQLLNAPVDFLTPQQKERIQEIEALSSPFNIRIIPLLGKTAVQTLGKKLFTNLQKSQFAFLTPDQVKQIRAPQQLERLLDEQLLHIDDSALSKIPPGRVQHLKPDQIKLLTRQDQIAKLGNGQFPYVAAPQLSQVPAGKVRYLKSGQVKLLRAKDQVVELVGDQFKQVDHSVLPLIPPGKVVHLDPAQVRLLRETAQIEQLADDQFKFVANTVLVKVAPEKVQHLSADQVKLLRAKEQIEKLVGDQFKQVDCAQLPKIPPEKVKHLSPGQVKLLTRQDQIVKLSKGQFPYVAAPQLSKVPAGKVRYLKSGQVKLLRAKDQVVELVGDQVKQVDSLVLPLIPPGKVIHLDPAQIRLLRETAQIKRLADDQLKFVANAVLVKVAPERVKHLSNEQIRARFLPGKWDRIQMRLCEILDLPMRWKVRSPEDAVRETWAAEDPSTRALFAHALAGALIGLLAMHRFPKSTVASLGALTIANEALNYSNRSIDPKASFAHRKRIRALLLGLQLVAVGYGLRQIASLRMASL